MRQSCVVLVALSLWGCGGESGAGANASTAAPAAAAEVAGLVREAPAGSAVVLLADAAGPDLLSQSASFLDARELGPDGAFRMPRPPAATRLLVLAPGRAIHTAPLPAPGDDWVLDPPPESTWTVHVRDDGGQPAEDALLLVLDAQGAPLPLPAHTLVADQTGRLVAHGLPAGRYTGLIQSGDARLHARVALTVGTAENAETRVTLLPDDALARQWLLTCGGDAAELARMLGSGGAE